MKIFDRDKIEELYKDGFSTRVISDKLKTSRYRVNKVIKESGIKIRDLSESHIKYTYNEDYFEKIDSDSKAYILGLLYADGNVCIKGKKRLQITLKDEDKYLLEFILKEIGDGTLYKDRVYTKITIYNDKIVNDLISLGCIPQKSLILKFPTEEQVPKILWNHFIRGYFDGDGCVTSCNSLGYVNSFTGCEEFMNNILDILSQRNIVFSKFRPRYKDKISAGSIVHYDTKSTGYLFFNYLYNNARIYMERKYLKMKKVIDECKDI